VLLGECFEGLGERGCIGYVNDSGYHGEAGLGDDGFKLFELVGHYIEACDHSALLEELEHDCAAYAPGGTGYYCESFG